MRLLFIECCDLHKRREGELPVALYFRPAAINPAQIRAIAPAGHATVPGGGGSTVQELVKIVTGSDPFFTLQSMSQLLEAWQKALDGCPPKKADDSTGASESSSSRAPRGDS